MTYSRSFPLCIVAVLLAGCAAKTRTLQDTPVLDEMAAIVQKHVPDKAKASEAVKRVDQMRTDGADYLRDYSEALESFGKLNADYDATREQFDAMIDQLRQKRSGIYSKMIDLTMEMRPYVTASEWTAIHEELAEREGH